MLNPHSLKKGSTILGRYEVVEQIGEGGFGVVYKARQKSTGQFVAIKLLLSEKLDDDDALQEEVGRFQREMELIGRFSHPNIVTLIDSGIYENQRFMVLEYITGRELSDIIKERGPLEPNIVKRIILQVLDALVDAHSMGIIHRDLKPQNIMISGPANRPNVKILDFGIAGIAETHREDDYKTLTQVGQIRGTPSYMAPEQIRFGTTSSQSDLYSVGLILLECLTGKRAITGECLQDICIKQVLEPLNIPDEIVHSPFGYVVMRSCLKEPGERYADSEEMLHDVEKLELSGMLRLDTGKFGAGSVTTGAFGRESISSQNPLLHSQNFKHSHSVNIQALHALNQSQQMAISQSFAQNSGVISTQMAVQGGKSKTGLIVGLLLFILIGGGAAAYFALNNGESDPNAEAASSVQGNGSGASGELGSAKTPSDPIEGKTTGQNSNSKPEQVETAAAIKPPLKSAAVVPDKPKAEVRKPLNLQVLNLIKPTIVASMGGAVYGQVSKPGVLSIWYIESNVPAKVVDAQNHAEILCLQTPCQIVLPRPKAGLGVLLKADKYESSKYTLETKGAKLVAVLKKYKSKPRTKPRTKTKTKPRTKTKTKPKSESDSTPKVRIRTFDDD